MRYGVIRSSPRLPAIEDQRRNAESDGCQAVFEARAHASTGQSRLLPVLERLKAGDEVMVHSLDAFDATVGELVRMMRGFCDVGVSLRILGGEAVDILEPQRPTPRVLALLADFEERHPSRTPTRRRARAVEPLLTPHQLKFARDMQQRGYGMREIGLLFRLSPNEVTALLSGGRRGQQSSEITKDNQEEIHPTGIQPVECFSTD